MHARAWVWSVRVVSSDFAVPMSVIDGRTVSLTSLIPDWLTNLGLIEANSIRTSLVEVLFGCATVVELVLTRPL